MMMLMMMMMMIAVLTMVHDGSGDDNEYEKIRLMISDYACLWWNCC